MHEQPVIRSSLMNLGASDIVIPISTGSVLAIDIFTLWAWLFKIIDKRTAEEYESEIHLPTTETSQPQVWGQLREP